MAKQKFVAWWPEDGEDFEDAVPVYECSMFGLELDMEMGMAFAAAEAAQYDYDNRDGWERETGEQVIVIAAVDDEGKMMGTSKTYDVTRGFKPEFYTTARKD